MNLKTDDDMNNSDKSTPNSEISSQICGNGIEPISQHIYRSCQECGHKEDQADIRCWHTPSKYVVIGPDDSQEEKKKGQRNYKHYGIVMS